MKLSTAVPLTPLLPQVDYDSHMVFLGSCFAKNIGKKLTYFGFNTIINPFGTLFNPVSLQLLIRRSMTDPSFTVNDVTGHFSYLAHSDLNAPAVPQVLQQLNLAASTLAQGIASATHVFVTLGSAWVYELKSTGQIVANCHKQPQNLFHKRLLSLQEIQEALRHLQHAVNEVNPSATIVYTLSPVRHLKDGFVENQRSKARLHECLQQQIGDSKAIYFPAYEIVMDELRDYRYYDRDMVHLNTLGVDYVWERFRESVINTNCNDTMKAVHKYKLFSAHRPENLALHQQQVEEMKVALLKQYPKINPHVS